MNDPKVGRVCKLVRFGQEEYTKPEQVSMLAGAGEEANSSSALTTTLERSFFARL